jgi:hypothetical protein
MAFVSGAPETPSSVVQELWGSEDEDPQQKLKREFAEWLNNIAASERVFKSRVYENADLNENDIRQHRCRVCALISMGEYLAIAFTMMAGKNPESASETKPIVAVIDQEVAKFFHRLISWHGPLDIQADVPDSFKQAAKEAKEDKIVNLDI